jgi:predicted protein tyrosine phosphatase
MGLSSAAIPPGKTVLSKTPDNFRMKLHIAGLEEAGAYRGKVSHLLAIIDPEDAPYLPHLGVPAENRLCLHCHDVPSRAEAAARVRELPGSRCIAPTAAMVTRALSFAKTLADGDTLLVVCGHGVSRSTALAFSILCQANSEITEQQVLERLLEIRPHAYPNALVVKLADALLKRQGRMSRVIAEHLSKGL